MDPIFLVGVPRSGTTMLRMVLDSHPNIYSSSETPWLAGNYRSNYGGTNVSIRGLYERMKFEPLSPLNSASYVNERAIKDAFRDLIVGIYKHQLSELGKRQWLEKTPDNIIQVPFLHDIFPNAKFIHVIRDGRDVALSTIETKWPGLNYFVPKIYRHRIKQSSIIYSLINHFNIFQLVMKLANISPNKFAPFVENYPTCPLWKPPCIKRSDSRHGFYFQPLPKTYYNALWRWCQWITKYEEDVKTLEVSSLTIRYEEVVMNPIEGFSKIFDFIGEHWSPEILRYWNYSHDKAKSGDTGVVSALRHDRINIGSIEKWKIKLSRRQKKLTHRHFDDFLAIKGYEKTV